MVLEREGRCEWQPQDPDQKPELMGTSKQKLLPGRSESAAGVRISGFETESLRLLHKLIVFKGRIN